MKNRIKSALKGIAVLALLATAGTVYVAQHPKGIAAVAEQKEHILIAFPKCATALMLMRDQLVQGEEPFLTQGSVMPPIMAEEDNSCWYLLNVSDSRPIPLRVLVRSKIVFDFRRQYVVKWYGGQEVMRVNNLSGLSLRDQLDRRVPPSVMKRLNDYN